MQHVFRPVNLGCQREFEAQEGKVQFWLELQRAPFIFFKSVFLVTTAHSLEPASKSRCTAHGLQVGNTQLPSPLPDPLSALHDKLSDSLRWMSHLLAEGLGLAVEM